VIQKWEGLAPILAVGAAEEIIKELTYIILLDSSDVPISMFLNRDLDPGSPEQEKLLINK